MKATLAAIEKLDWAAIHTTLDRDGLILCPKVMTAEAAAYWRDCYHDDGQFRATINMAEKRYGFGHYRHFAEGANLCIDPLREALYRQLYPLANKWMQHTGQARRFPAQLDAFDRECREVGQPLPTSLLLHYPLHGYCTMHQDVYGSVYFPFQVLFCLSRREQDFSGAEFVFIEDIPGAQSRPRALQPDLGDMVIFTTRTRPEYVDGIYCERQLSHGICPVQRGERYALAVIFHHSAY